MPQLEIATIVMKDAVSVLIGKQKGGPDDGKWVIPGGVVRDGETMVAASERIMLEEAGVKIAPKQVLFLSESLEPLHRIAVFCFAEYAGGEPTPGASLAEAKFVDPRTLGDYQKEGMSGLTEEAFYKFSLILKGQAAAAPKSGTV